MKHWEEYIPYNYTTVKNNKKVEVCDDIFCFDCEASSGFFVNGQLMEYSDEKYDLLRTAGVKCAWLYIWMFGVNNEVYYGRTLEELKDFLYRLADDIPYKKICYVHNLSYDSQWLFNIFNMNTIEIFARKSRTPMKIYVPEYDIEFRCSYILTNLSLDNCAKRYNCAHQKLKGNLDYNKHIYPTTQLTSEELAYCENDIKVMQDFLQVFKDEYQTVHNIPLTQTGEVRRAIGKALKGDINYIRKIQNWYPTNVEEFLMADACFWGGYTHANALHAGQIIEGVKSKDEASAYIKALFSKMPLGRFIRTRYRRFDFEHKYYYFHVKFYGVHRKLFNSYIPYSKCLVARGAVLDNGRIAEADYIEIKCTSVDYQIIKEVYDIDEEQFEDVMVCNRIGYLPKQFLSIVLEFYSRKTILKGATTDYEIAMLQKSKQYLNSMYGMSVTRVTGAEISIEDDGVNNFWKVGEVTTEYIRKKLEKQGNSYKCYTSFHWGVFIAAISRLQLWSICKGFDYKGVHYDGLDEDIIYMDTDSVKYEGEHDDIFDAYNRKCIDELNDCACTMGLDINLFIPADRKGKLHPCGIYEDDGSYKRFTTMGAKKYAYEDEQGGLHITVSGVSKNGAKALTKLEDFDEGFIFDTKHCGKQLITYIDRQEPFNLPDGSYIHQAKAVHMMPTTYELSMARTFKEYIWHLQEKDWEDGNDSFIPWD